MDINQPEKLAEIMEIARSIAWGASDILSSFYHGQDDDLDIKDKKDGPVTKADLAANKHIVGSLQAQLSDYDFGYLSEETFDVKKAEPIAKDWVWIIDPLDGTRDFIDKTGEFGLHIALAYQGRPMLAIVGIPEAGKLYLSLIHISEPTRPY